MIDKSTDQMLPLGWLALSASAHLDGFLPRFRKMKQDGLSIIDEWGFLTPDLYWRHGRGLGESRLECFYAFNLLESACTAAIGAGYRDFGSSSQTEFVHQLTQLAKVEDFDHTSVCIFSPRVPEPFFRRSWLAALPTLLPYPYRFRLGRLLRDPALLIRVGYQMLVTEWSAHGPSRPETAEALAIFGLGALGLFPRWRCANCFRISMPGTTRCWLHRQVGFIREVDKKLHSRQSATARLGRRVMKELQWSKDDFLNLHHTDSQIEEKSIASILWGLHASSEKSLFDELRIAFTNGQYPQVQALLPSNFNRLSNARALARLHRHIDTNEWCISCWYNRVYAAEEWINMASRLSPGRQHMKVTRRTHELVSEARELINQGLSQKEAAARLKITPPYISRLLKRFHSI
ncbi:MAG: helix-turn-helix domain-containing protein [Gammaproteobacteria bacterium]|nr:helix-turn-helix domain-containing protein [Gammaproteobacteria bacterium]MBU0786865.1 helix-turn-helix domain-containing protein [Gammaproteobacteria bacterium]MBU0813929.1 helix-turn-helix domain-containing protein [Gammaproteobacteria bacterium]MBU1788598.1 helix-turn-helix domain-containing protein [Gammaproteobacteria bacterium]